MEIGIILLSVLAAFLAAVVIWLWVSNIRKTNENQQLHADYLLMKDHALNANQHNVQLQEELDCAKRQLSTALDNNVNAENTLNSRYTALRVNIAAAENQLAQLNTEVESKNKELNKILNAMVTQNQTLTNMITEYNEYHKLYTVDIETRNQLLTDIGVAKSDIVKLEESLSYLKETNRVALLKDYKNDQNWFDFNLSNKEQTLIETITKLIDLYPELTKDFATIEWKKLWLPKLQDAANTYNLNCGGIYRLVLKSDEKVSYVGQALSIKDRWYEHAKKMIGADSKGNEKLYKYRPEDFYWTILETGKVNLNEREHYWIDYYCCKELGLNKKA